jgi:hypothetical protein
MNRLIRPTIAGAAVLACATGATAAHPTGTVADHASRAARAPVVVAEPAIVGLGTSASITVRGFAGPRLLVRLAGATTPGGHPLGWRPLLLTGTTWRGSLPKPALRGIYPIELRAGAGRPVVRSPNWMFRVYASGTLSRPTFATADEVARWWVRALPEHARLVALKRWRRPAFDRRDRRLHQLLVIAYSPAGHPLVRDRLGMFITAVRDGFNGRWRLLESTVAP